MTDAELLERFESATLSADDFPHREHLRLALIYLRERPLIDVLERFPLHLRALAKAFGADELYHETVTWFFLMSVHERIARRGSCGSWEWFALQNPDLLERSDTILSRHYRSETWQSPLAKERFLLPDGASF